MISGLGRHERRLLRVRYFHYFLFRAPLAVEAQVLCIKWLLADLQQS